MLIGLEISPYIHLVYSLESEKDGQQRQEWINENGNEFD